MGAYSERGALKTTKHQTTHLVSTRSNIIAKEREQTMDLFEIIAKRIIT